MITIMYLNTPDYIDAYNFNGYLIDTPYSSCPDRIYSKKEMLDIISRIHNKNKIAVLKMDKILLESEREDILKNYVDMICAADYVMFEDLAFVEILKNSRIKGVFAPFDNLNSKEDINVAFDKICDTILLCPGQEELLNKYKFSKTIGVRACYEDRLFYSRRKLLSLSPLVEENKIDLEIQEESRSINGAYESMKETSSGTVILAHQTKIIQKALWSKADFVLFDTSFMSEAQVKENLLRCE